MPNPTTAVVLRSLYTVRNWGLHDTPEFVELEGATPSRVGLMLRRVRPDEVDQHRDKDDWIAELRTKLEVSARQFEQLKAGGDPPHPSAAELKARVSSEQRDFLDGVLSTTRWLTGFIGHHRPVRGQVGTLEWSVDDQTWTPIQPVFTFGHSSSELVSVPYSAGIIAKVTNLLCVGDREPAAHELFREAWNLKSQSPRSALILGLSALEVGAKACVALLVPNSEWLCFEAPTPPVLSVLEEYLPTLPTKARLNGKVYVPLAALGVIKKAVAQRNRVAHRGSKVDAGKSLYTTLETIRGVLYLLDYYCGQSWAAPHLRGFIDDADFEWLVSEHNRAAVARQERPV